MTAVLLPQGRQQFFTTTGVPAVGYKLMTWAAGTSTPQTTWADAGKIAANTNPIILDGRGEAVIFWDGVYKIQLQDASGAPVWPPVDNISSIPSFSTSVIPTLDNTYTLGSPSFSWANLYLGVGDAAAYDVPSGNIAYYKITAAETAAGLAVTNFSIPPYPINVLRYGIVPNSVPAAAANGAILRTLLNYNTPGPTGLCIFPNTTGADIYSFTGVCTVRQFINIDLMGSTISVTGASTGVNDVNVGFFYPLSDVIIENGAITTAVNTAAGVNAGACIWVGARGAGFYYTVYDSLQGAGKSLGRVILRNLTLSNNNTGGNSAPPLGMLGGLSNVLVENVTISCNGVVNTVGAPGGIYYEWGWATSPPSTSTTQCSNGHNMRFSNIRITNCAGVALGLTGCYNAVVDGLFTNNCAQDFVYSVGEAMFYLPWVGVDQFGAKRNIHLLNLVGQGTTGTAVQLVGSNVGSGTFYGSAGVVFTAAQQTDLMTFTLDNVKARSIVVSGPIVARNCQFDAGGSALNPVTVNDDCISADFTSCQALNGTGTGIRANIAGTGIWGTPRLKYLSWRGGLIAGNVGSGVQIGANTRAARFTDVQVGYNALNNGQGNEATQTLGISVGGGGNNVICERCFVTTSGGNAYDITGTTTSGCDIRSPLGTVTSGGAWDTDGVGFATAANLAIATFIANTNNKYAGRMYRANDFKLYVAQGSAATGAGGGTWKSIDGATTITPV